ncbi:MAG: hypothetical protein KGV51_05550 [Moraxellaceae bacterium]|nr:hypothetical protein [Moraxellaceae bacterium]
MIVATLGDNNTPSTCSFLSTEHRFPNENIQLFNSFEDCITQVKIKNSDITVIPSAYPFINPIIMDEKLEVFDVFLYKIPNLVIATHHRNNLLNIFDNLFYHPATETLLKKAHVRYSFLNKNTVQSNTESAQKAIKIKNSACITNEYCVNKFDLKILQVLRKDLVMPFLCFKRKD